MIVCSCNVLSDREIRNVATAAQVQPLSAHQVYGCLGCNMRCGRCARTVKQILSEALIGAQSLGRPFPRPFLTKARARQTSAALRDFDPAYDRCGSFTTDAGKPKGPRTSASSHNADKPADILLSPLCATCRHGRVEHR